MENQYVDRYKKYSPEVQETMKLIMDNVEMEDGYLTILDLIAINYVMLYDSIADIRKNGYEKQDTQGRVIKNHAVQTFNNSQMAIVKLLNQFPSNPLSKARLKKLESDDMSGDSPLDEFM